MVAQAVTASTAAYKAGVKFQKLELLLPLIGATDLDDWCALAPSSIIHLDVQQVVQLHNNHPKPSVWGWLKSSNSWLRNQL